MYGIFCGGAKGIRTPDLLNAIQTRYQLRHDPIGVLLTYITSFLRHRQAFFDFCFVTFLSKSQCNAVALLQ